MPCSERWPTPRAGRSWICWPNAVPCRSASWPLNYRLEPDALIAELTPWIAKYEQYWSAALERLRDLAQDRGAKHRLASRKIVRRRRLK